MITGELQLVLAAAEVVHDISCSDTTSRLFETAECGWWCRSLARHIHKRLPQLELAGWHMTQQPRIAAELSRSVTRLLQSALKCNGLAVAIGKARRCSL